MNRLILFSLKENKNILIKLFISSLKEKFNQFKLFLKIIMIVKLTKGLKKNNLLISEKFIISFEAILDI